MNISHSRLTMVTLTTVDKILIMACGFGVVLLTIIIVVCVVTPVCPLHRLLPEQSRLRASQLGKSFFIPFPKLMFGPFTACFSPPYSSSVPKKGKNKKKKSKTEVNCNTELTQLKNGSTYVSYGNDVNLNSDIIQTPADPNGTPYKAQAPQRRPTVLSTRESTVDSTYSSMTPTGSRPSTPVSSKVNAIKLK